MGLGQMMSVNPDFSLARASAHAVLKVINREPLIDGRPDAPGLKDPVEGAVQLRNLRFTFPSRPTDEVIRGINCNFPAGTIVGVVGHSGAGKSTLISLIERFYDPTSGAILIDGKDSKRYDAKNLSFHFSNHLFHSFNLFHLRQNIGLVSQEPQLFDLSISDNIRFGKLDATEEEIIYVMELFVSFCPIC